MILGQKQERGLADQVELYHWNPRRLVWTGRLGRRLNYRRPLNNFGDLLGPLLVRALLRQENIDISRPVRPARLLSVGSVMHFAGPGDVVWGTGVNGKISFDRLRPEVVSTLSVRAVRGPRSRAVLEDLGVQVPEVYGDPGLLVPELLPEIAEAARSKRFDVTFVPNLNDTSRPVAAKRWTADPQASVGKVLIRIARSRFVVGSSLHAIVVAESLGIPARLIKPEFENDFKYADYYGGTGRDQFVAARGLEEALDLGGEAPAQWSSAPLRAAFPRDLWVPGAN